MIAILFTSFADWLAVGDPATQAGADLLKQRFRSLQKQVPHLYLSVLACFVGLHLATSGALLEVRSPVTFVVILVLIRLVAWHRRRSLTKSAEAIVKHLVATFFFSLFFSTAFSAWAIYLAWNDAQEISFVVLFGSLASVGCAYGLSSFPKAARIPLLILGLPISVAAMLTAQAGFVGLGIALFLIILLVTRVLSTHNHELTQLSLSRSAIEQERQRAVEAEAVAIEERARATKVAFCDHLTGLPNRASFMASLENGLHGENQGKQLGAIAIIDLDGFKPINDAFGHGLGDAVLKVVGGRLLDNLKGTQTCARLGGDEFAVLLRDCKSEEAAEAAGRELLLAINRPINIEDREFVVSGCCGMALLTLGDDVSEALVRADLALYDCKGRGKSLVRVFSSSMEASRIRRLNIERKLRDPSTRSLISLVYQPIFSLKTGALYSFEALARWQVPDLGVVDPSEFIPAAEQLGVIKEISEALFKAALAEALTWPAWVMLSFNLSAPQLCAPELADDLLRQLATAKMDPRRLEIEVTETVLLVNFEAARRNLAKLRSSGVRVVVDDFGAGYASISYLQEMQFDGVKIDGSLVQSATKSLNSYRLLKGVVQLCASLAVPCVAEHIETEEQYALLKEMRCARGQGHLLGRAVDPESARLLATSTVCLSHVALATA